MVEVIASDLQRQGEHMTERFLLRPLRPSDAGLIAHYTADRRVADTSLSDIVNLIVGEKFTARSAAAH